jgi:hypothetical protein
MIDCWQQWRKAIRGHTPLTPGFRCDRLPIEMSDEASSYQTF